MLKLLYKPTGNIFTLPDAEGLRIKREDRGNDYEILDCGNLPPLVKDVLNQYEVKAIEEERQEALEAEKKEFEDAKEDKDEVKVNPNHKKFEIKEDYSNMTRAELAILAEKVTGKYVDPTKTRKDKIIAIIEGKQV